MEGNWEENQEQLQWNSVENHGNIPHTFVIEIYIEIIREVQPCWLERDVLMELALDYLNNRTIELSNLLFYDNLLTTRSPKNSGKIDCVETLYERRLVEWRP